MVRAMADHRVDLLILDVMLSAEDGLSLVPQGPRGVANADHPALFTGIARQIRAVWIFGGGRSQIRTGLQP
jgi:hypothetical protein